MRQVRSDMRARLLLRHSLSLIVIIGAAVLSAVTLALAQGGSLAGEPAEE